MGTKTTASLWAAAIFIAQLSIAHASDPAQFNVLKKIDDDDLRITGYVASRSNAAANDYRVYVGVGYKSELGSIAKLTSRAFYGSGTYDGINANSGALPEDVRTNNSLPGNWLGANWKAESHLFAGHTFTASFEVRERLPFDVLDLHSLTGNVQTQDPTQPDRRVGVVTQNDLAIFDDVALKVRTHHSGDSSGLEVGMERSLFGSTRGRLSYSRLADNLEQQITKMSLDVPILPKRLTTSFELQYMDIGGALAGKRRSDSVIGNLTLASAALSGDTRVTLGMRNLFDAPATDERSVHIDFTRRL